MFYKYAATGKTFEPNRHEDEFLEDWYDDPTEEYVYFLIYNRQLTEDEMEQRELVFLYSFN